MIFFNYKQPKAEYVQFQRLIMGLLILTSVLSENMYLIYIYLALSIISLFSTVFYSPTTLVFRLLSFIMGKPFFTTPPQYAHSYLVNRLAEFFEDIMRIGAGIAIIYLYTFTPLVAWIMASFVAVAMLISSFFGFCLSSLMYIGYKFIMKKMDK